MAEMFSPPKLVHTPFDSLLSFSSVHPKNFVKLPHGPRPHQGFSILTGLYAVSRMPILLPVSKNVGALMCLDREDFVRVLDVLIVVDHMAISPQDPSRGK